MTTISKLAGLAALAVLPACAGVILYQGAFAEDDDSALFSFNVASDSVVTIESWGYAGGTVPHRRFQLLFWLAALCRTCFSSMAMAMKSPATTAVTAASPGFSRDGNPGFTSAEFSLPAISVTLLPRSAQRARETMGFRSAVTML